MKPTDSRWPRIVAAVIYTMICAGLVLAFETLGTVVVAIIIGTMLGGILLMLD
jgi:hypothetical protein